MILIGPTRIQLESLPDSSWFYHSYLDSTDSTDSTRFYQILLIKVEFHQTH
jgi:hypothetical protein